MSRRARGAALSALAAVALSGSTTPAPAQEAVGRWGVTWAQAVRRNRDGSVEIERWGDALLVLERDGEALSGTWTNELGGGTTWQVTGSLEGSRLRLRATEHDSDDPELAIVESMNWEATLEGDRLEGTTWIVLTRQARETIRRPWRAVRAPG